MRRPTGATGASIRSTLPARNATVEVDGTALVKDGKLAAGTVVAGR